ADGGTQSGCTVHYVVPEMDSGPVILQKKVDVRPGDTADTLAARVLAQEHRLYPQAIHWFTEGRLTLKGEQVWFDGKSLVEPLKLEDSPIR
ncbi:MAG: phosphoribosylglycinamide formyltransferase, partial [Candidatus Competibacteraceae bacterium]|nr:phosphoribosylglycinamide formyltransferase [Candidatus Competibacteraceae bacterium]